MPTFHADRLFSDGQIIQEITEKVIENWKLGD